MSFRGVVRELAYSHRARHNPAVVESLYGDFKHQCPNCARRFHERDDMDQHMDWHFRMNKKEKEKQKQSVSRGWYLTADVRKVKTTVQGG